MYEIDTGSCQEHYRALWNLEFGGLFISMCRHIKSLLVRYATTPHYAQKRY